MEYSEGRKIIEEGKAFAKRAIDFQQEKKEENIVTAIPNEDDPTILISSDIRDAILIREHNVKAVHIKRKLPDIFNEIAKIGLDSIVFSLLFTCDRFEEAKKHLPNEEGHVLGENLLEAVMDEKRSTQVITSGAFGYLDDLGEAFYNVSSYPKKGAYIFHADPEDFTAVQALHGEGVEYLAGEGLTVKEVNRGFFSKLFEKNKVKKVIAEQGDIVLFKGTGHVNPRPENKCLIHRSPEKGERIAFAYRKL